MLARFDDVLVRPGRAGCVVGLARGHHRARRRGVRRVVARRGRAAVERSCRQRRTNEDLLALHRPSTFCLCGADGTDEPPPCEPPVTRSRGSPGSLPAASIWSRRGVPIPVDPAGTRSGDGSQPDRLLRPPHELRPRRAAHRAARRVLRRARRGRFGADHHRGALDPPDRLALREADPRLPPRRDPGLPAHHRRRAPPSGPGLRPDQPQRRPGVVDVHPAAGVGAVGRRRPALPRGPQGGHAGRDRRDRRRLRDGGRALRRGRLRRDRAAVQPLLDRARLPLPRHQPAHRRLRRHARQPGPAAARDRRRRPARDRHPPRPRRAAVR